MLMLRSFELDGIKEGATEPLDWQLYEVDDEGTVTNLNGTGFTVQGVTITAADGQVVPTTSKLAWLVQASGTVRYTPASDGSDFKAVKSPYRVTVQLLDGNSKLRNYPKKQDALLYVHRV
jgi:hypothetical protein